MSRFFHLYQFLGPALLTPLAAFLWLRHYHGDARLAAIAVVVPILHAYIVPGIGANILKMWAFNTRLRLGNFRPQHGFVFGSATALLALPLMGAPDPAASPADIALTAALVGAALFVVNWIYDALALKHGFLEVYNQPWADGAGPWSIAADYSPWFFGVFGLIYGAGLKISERVLIADPSPGRAWLCGALMTGATVCAPTLLYMAASLLRHGHAGLRPCVRDAGTGCKP